MSQDSKTTVIKPDVDGIAPGIEPELMFKFGVVTFSGHFFAQPEVPHQEFDRPVQIIFASKEILVCLDMSVGNIYVIDREKELSLGCRMKAKFTENVITKVA